MHWKRHAAYFCSLEYAPKHWNLVSCFLVGIFFFFAHGLGEAKKRLIHMDM